MPTTSGISAELTDAYRWYAEGDCVGVRTSVRRIDSPDGNMERELARLLEAYCLELDGNVPAAREQYESIVARVPTLRVAYDAALRLLDLERHGRRGTTRVDEKIRIESEHDTQSPLYEHVLPPRFRVNPDYPPELRKAGIEGWVMIDFEISSDGTVADPAVIGSEPPFLFEGSALSAIRTWIYEPHAGDPPLRRTVRLEFQLEELSEELASEPPSGR